MQLPKISDATKNLAANLTHSSNSAQEKAFSILNHFRDFSYSLDMKNDPDKTALEYFLFDRKEGHCEYFASAMVILLRETGIPARLVNGFAGAEWHDWGNYLIVRQSHAHSWVEAYLPGRGWVVFDPTPPDPDQMAALTPGPFARTLDLMRMNWQRYIIRYSYKDQVSMAQFFRSSSREAMDSLKNLTSLGWEDVLKWTGNQRWILLVLLITICLVFFFRNRGKSPTLPEAVMLYKELQKRLEKKGVNIKSCWTARELLNSNIPAENFNQAKQIIDYYEKVRFGNQSANPSIEKEIKGSLNSI